MDEKLLIEVLDAAIKGHPFRPAGIVVGDALYAAIKRLNGRASIQQWPMNELFETDQLVLDGNIYVHRYSLLPDTEYILPLHPANSRGEA